MTTSTHDRPVHLPGLDGSNPLAFLATLGLMRALDHRAKIDSRRRPLVSWVDDGYWQPVLHHDASLDGVIIAVLEDKETWTDDPAMLLAYDESGTTLLDPRTPGSKATRDLKPRPDAMSMFLDRIAGISESADLDRRGWFAAGRTMQTAGAYGSEFVQDNNGNTKPMALHFTAGQQKFLDAVAKIREGIVEDDVREALLGPWERTSKLPSMSWDATVARIYALRATNPSNEKRGSTPGADWLAFMGLGFLAAVPRGGILLTTCVRGGWKDGVFTWPLWTVPASADVIRSLLATVDLPKLSQQERAARGIGTIFSSSIARFDQRGYGSFTPARVE